MGNQDTRWREASDVISLFPTLVCKVELYLRHVSASQASR
jgi:hypothetical protein